MYKTTEIVNTQTKLVSALETIESVTINNKEHFLGLDDDWTKEYTRDLGITVNGNDYTITWYHNLCTLRSDWCEIPFNSIVLSKPTWPTEIGSKLKLQLKNNDVTVAVI